MRTLRVVALAMALLLGAPAAASSETHFTAYSDSEATDLWTAANYLGMSPAEVQRFGVSATRFVLELSGAQPQPLTVPDHTGNHVVHSTYPQGSDLQAALHWVGAFYSVDGPRAQRIGATFMVFLAGIDAATKGLPYPVVRPPALAPPTAPTNPPTTKPSTTTTVAPTTTTTAAPTTTTSTTTTTTTTTLGGSFVTDWPEWWQVNELHFIHFYSVALGSLERGTYAVEDGTTRAFVRTYCSDLQWAIERMAELRTLTSRYRDVTPRLLGFIGPGRWEDMLTRCWAVPTGERLAPTDPAWWIAESYLVDLGDRWMGPWWLELHQCVDHWFGDGFDIAPTCGPVPFGES